MQPPSGIGAVARRRRRGSAPPLPSRRKSLPLHHHHHTPRKSSSCARGIGSGKRYHWPAGIRDKTTATKKLEACLKSSPSSRKIDHENEAGCTLRVTRGGESGRRRCRGVQAAEGLQRVHCRRQMAVETSNFILEMYLEKMHNCYKALMEDITRSKRGVARVVWRIR